jgi:uncharacterized SAM-binding protein YcdF (DUF218 family)
VALYLSKVVALFALPLGWALLLGLAAVLFLVLGRRRAATAMIAAQLALLWACAMPWTANRLMAWAEGGYPPVALAQTPEADVAVVLGGGLGPVGDPPVENLSDAADRVLRAARLYRHGKIQRVLAAGGNIPWLSGSVPEAKRMRDLLVEWGVPHDAVWVETESRNTRQNARFAARIIRREGWRRVLLITSAAHMERAVGAFRAEGLEVIPSPTDYHALGDAPLDLLDFLPDAGAFSQTSWVVREAVGRVVYQLTSQS